MKTAAVLALAICYLFSLCHSIPIAEEIQQIQTPLDGKTDLAARVNAFSFLYDNILKDLFSGLVTNTFNHVSSTLNNLIETNPLGLGKRSTDEDLVARVNAFSFLYDNILKDLFSGLVTNTFNHVSSTLNNLIETNPLGLGKRDADEDLVARVNAFSFLYDNILKDLFSGLVTNTFNHVSSTLNNLIETNPLGLGKRSADISFDGLANLISHIITHTVQQAQIALDGIFSKPSANARFDVVNIEQAKTVVAEVVSVLIEKAKTFVREAATVWSDREKLSELVKENVEYLKMTVMELAQQLSQVIPSTINQEVSQVLGALQSVIVYLTSGLAGSLGPVLGPFSL